MLRTTLRDVRLLVFMDWQNWCCENLSLSAIYRFHAIDIKIPSSSRKFKKSESYMKSREVQKIKGTDQIAAHCKKCRHAHQWDRTDGNPCGGRNLFHKPVLLYQVSTLKRQELLPSFKKLISSETPKQLQETEGQQFKVGTCRYIKKKIQNRNSKYPSLSAGGAQGSVACPTLVQTDDNILHLVH